MSTSPASSRQARPSVGRGCAGSRVRRRSCRPTRRRCAPARHARHGETPPDMGRCRRSPGVRRALFAALKSSVPPPRLRRHDEDGIEVVGQHRVGRCGAEHHRGWLDHAHLDNGAGEGAELAARLFLVSRARSMEADDVFRGQPGAVVEAHAAAQAEFPGGGIGGAPAFRRRARGARVALTWVSAS